MSHLWKRDISLGLYCYELFIKSLLIEHMTMYQAPCVKFSTCCLSFNVHNPYFICPILGWVTCPRSHRLWVGLPDFRIQPLNHGAILPLSSDSHEDDSSSITYILLESLPGFIFLFFKQHPPKFTFSSSIIQLGPESKYVYMQYINISIYPLKHFLKKAVWQDWHLRCEYPLTQQFHL